MKQLEFDFSAPDLDELANKPYRGLTVRIGVYDVSTSYHTENGLFWLYREDTRGTAEFSITRERLKLLLKDWSKHTEPEIITYA